MQRTHLRCRATHSLEGRAFLRGLPGVSGGSAKAEYADVAANTDLTADDACVESFLWGDSF
jgi:hypothetical protein